MRRLALLAHNVRSLWNVGAFFRTADAFAVEKVYLTGYTGHPPRPEIAKTAIGAENWVPWEHAKDPAPVLKALRADGWKIVALELTPTAADITRYEPGDKLCLILGHEVTGVPPELLAFADDAVKIPMLGRKESLNVSVAAGIALHHFRSAPASQL